MTHASPVILVVDDDRRLRELLGRFLASEGFRIESASHAAEAERMLENNRPDLMVLDVMMPGEDGIAFTRRIRPQHPVPVLMLTAMGESDDRIRGLRAGVDDYLTKPFEPEELVLRIRAILRRYQPEETPTAPGTPDAVRFGPFRYLLTTHKLEHGKETVYLTPSEQKLLHCLAASPGLPVPRETLSSTLGATISERSVDVQINRLRRRIEKDPRRPDYLRTVRHRGYRLEAEPDSAP